MSWLSGIIVAAIGALIAEWANKEVENWAPRIIRRVLGAAVRRLPEARRARFDEEWHACLLDLPTPISQLVFVIGTCVAAERIRLQDLHSAKKANGSFARSTGGSGAAVMMSTGYTLVYRSRGALWFVGCVSIVLGFYLVNMQVATMRQKVRATEASIQRARLEISALEARLARGEAVSRAGAVRQ